MTEYVFSRVRLLYAFLIEPMPNEYLRAHCSPGEVEVASNQFVLAPSIIFAAPVYIGRAQSGEHTVVLRSARRHQHFLELPPIPKWLQSQIDR